MKKWSANYGSNKILIENRWYRESLFVNGELQDERLGLNLSQACMENYLLGNL